MPTVRTGIDVLVADNFAPLHGMRVGLMTNHSGVNRDLVSTVRLLHHSDAVQLVALYGPEHGVAGSAGDGEAVADGRDPLTGLAVYSLYGDTMRPSAEMLAPIDVLVCDIQDVGARFYTYLWTVSHVLEACGAHEVGVMILDRPNPLGGEAIAGRGLDAPLASFVGRYDIPMQHGMTLGELGQMLNATVNPTPANLLVVPCQHLSRAMVWEDTGLPFVPPSPAMPTPTTAAHYPGACLLEGTNLSEGRGTALPFEVVGAPYVQADALADQLNALGLAGVRFRPQRFEPSASKHAGVMCEGVQAHITERRAYRPIETWLHVIHTIRQMYPDDFGWREPFREGDASIFDKLIGSARPREQLDSGVDVETIMAGWETYCNHFREQRTPHLLYT